MPDGVLGQAFLSEAEAYTNLIEALRVAESAASQLAHLRGQPQWLNVRLALEATRDTVTNLALSGALKRR